ncbi:MAG: prolyl oligopeptidase family serine peptidase, partial [SAR324 cluster bacterium]|nr:prolyl oligopeptidase family serine peptidase [SAR324 cluster bacterium]
GDVIAGLDWMAGQEGVRPRGLAVIGLGRGGQLALLAAAASKKPRAVAAFGAPADISAWRATTGHPGIAEWIGTVCGAGRRARLRSPAAAAGRIEAPVLLIHGEDNRRVPPAQSRLMRDALTRRGGRVETLFLSGATHRFSPEQSERAWRRLEAFLRKALR